MVDGYVAGQAVVFSGFVLGNGTGTFSSRVFLAWNRNLQLTRNLQEAMEINCHLSKRASQEVGAESKEFSPEGSVGVFRWHQRYAGSEGRRFSLCGG